MNYHKSILYPIFDRNKSSCLIIFISKFATSSSYNKLCALIQFVGLETQSA